MSLSLRQKLTIASLVLYWSVIFILTHIPIPGWVRRAGVSDKSLHFIAYLVLVTLFWFAISSDQRIKWCKARVWWVILATAVYAAADELLQGCVNRNTDMADVLANLSGVGAGLLLLSFLAFWPALLVVTAIVIFLLTNITRANLADMLPVTSAISYLLGYGFFTILWLRNLAIWFKLKVPSVKWLISALGLPAVFLVAMKFSSIILNRSFEWRNVIISASGIVTVVVLSWIVGLFRRRFS